MGVYCKRLAYLEVPSVKIDAVRKKYVENIILAQMLREKLNHSAKDTKNLISRSSESSIDYLGLINYGVAAAKIGGLVLPYFSESAK